MTYTEHAGRLWGLILLAVTAMLCLLLVAVRAPAGCVVRNRAAVVTNVVAVEAVAAVAVVATPVIVAQVPVYSTGYVAPPPPPAAPAAQPANDSMLRALQDINRRLDGLERRGQQAPAAPQPLAHRDAPATMPPADPPQARAAQVPALYARSCVQCHGASKPKGGLALVDASGALAKLSCETKLEVLRRINLGPDDPEVMPPKAKGPAVTDQEEAEVKALLTAKP